MARFIMIAAVLIAAILGIVFQDDPYRLRSVGMPADQLALDHRDSPYSHVTWVVSHDSNYAQLRFFDKVEGGVCLEPRWEDLQARKIDHLAMPTDYAWDSGDVGKRWPQERKRPNPGTLSNTRYINLYPLGILLNQPLMAAANWDWRKTQPDILIVGLGSGVGIANLAHHFPDASITCVDIDQVVIDMVRDHYPLLRWLEEEAPPTSAGKHRLKLVANDARQYTAFPELRGGQDTYDLVILDAYTSGSTIPPHLMTREYYTEIANILDDGGIILSNIIGSYSGSKSRVLGGAIRSMQASPAHHIHNFPIYYWLHGQTEANFDQDQQSRARNNVVLASKNPLNPKLNRKGWEAIDSFMQAGFPYAELPTGRYLSVMAALFDNETGTFSSVQGSLLGADGTALDASLLRTLKRDFGNQPEDGRGMQVRDANLKDQIVAAVRKNKSEQGLILDGWTLDGNQGVSVSFTDWVTFARTTFATSVDIAQDRSSPTVYTHSGENIVGPVDQAATGSDLGLIKNPPLFTDHQPNADIYNN